MVARCASEVDGGDVREVEEILLGRAATVDAGELQQEARRLQQSLDGAAGLAGANRRFERRRLRLSETSSGCFVVEGQLDAEGGATLRSALESLMKPRRGDTRTAVQRRADAIVALAQRHLDEGTVGTRNRVRPHLTVTVPAALLEGDAATGAELEGVGPVTPELARRLGCDATINRVTLDAAGEPVTPVLPGAGCRRRCSVQLSHAICTADSR